MPSIDRKKKTRQNKLLYIFLLTFFVSLVTMIYLATALTPDIDVDVNTDNESSVSEISHQEIDSRLKDIQQDDQNTTTTGRIEIEDETSDLLSNLKKMKEETIAKQLDKEESIEIQDDEDPMKPITITQKPKLASPEYTRQKSQTTESKTQTKQATTTKMAKVYVGRYTDFEQAIKVQNALINASLASSPFIKNLGGYYVIQVGSFANHQTAQNIAENLITNGYSARMVLE